MKKIGEDGLGGEAGVGIVVVMEYSPRGITLPSPLK